MKFLKNLLLPCLLTLFLNGTLVAQGKISHSDWIMDEHYVLRESTSRTLEQLLSRAAKIRGIDIQVFILREPSEKDLSQTLKQKIIDWETVHPKSKQNRAYLVIEVNSERSFIVLGEDLFQTSALKESLSRIQNNIVQKALNKGNVAHALIEGSIALTTILGKVEQTDKELSIGERLIAWLDKFELLIPLEIISFLGLGLGAWFGLKRFLHVPHWEDTPIDFDILEERMGLARPSHEQINLHEKYD